MFVGWVVAEGVDPAVVVVVGVVVVVAVVDGVGDVVVVVVVVDARRPEGVVDGAAAVGVVADTVVPGIGVGIGLEGAEVVGVEPVVAGVGGTVQGV